MLSLILVKGGVSLQFQALGVKCEEMGFKNPSNAFYSKASHERQAQYSENIVSGLKCKQVGNFSIQRRGSINGADRWSSGKPEP
jgi:hypothetical protein